MPYGVPVWRATTRCTRGAHVRCTHAVHTCGAHMRCTCAVPTCGTHVRCFLVHVRAFSPRWVPRAPLSCRVAAQLRCTATPHGPPRPRWEARRRRLRRRRAPLASTGTRVPRALSSSASSAARCGRLHPHAHPHLRPLPNPRSRPHSRPLGSPSSSTPPLPPHPSPPALPSCRLPPLHPHPPLPGAAGVPTACHGVARLARRGAQAVRGRLRQPVCGRFGAEHAGRGHAVPQGQPRRAAGACRPTHVYGCWNSMSSSARGRDLLQACACTCVVDV